MPGRTGRSLALIDLLACHPEGLAVGAIAVALSMPASGAHRLLVELVRLGHVRQLRAQGDHALTLRLPALGLAFLAR
jgi:DNA-binding IclR family transcriptional regulator